jgi:hypothetical protein
MLDFPQSTYFGKRIPKEKFYLHLEPNYAVQQRFVNEIGSIIWRNKFSAGTLNVAAGKSVVEIDVLEILLKQRPRDGKLLELVDRNLPHHVVFILLHNGLAQAVVHYKEKSGSCFSILETFRTEWMDYRKLSLSVSGLNLDEVYENFIRQTAGKRLSESKELGSLRDQILRMQEHEKLERQIRALETKIRNEKQFNRQVEIKEEIRKLREAMKVRYE